MRKIDCAYVRLVDVSAVALWCVSFALLLLDQFTGDREHSSWLSRWSVMAGFLALATTIVAVVSWGVRELTIKDTIDSIDDLVARRRK